MRNSDQSNSSQRRGQKNRRPSNSNNRRGGSDQRRTNSSNNRSGQQGSGNGQHRSSSQGKSRNEIAQAWASDTSTLSSHMPTLARNDRNDRNSKGRKTENGANPRSRGKNKPTNERNRSGRNDRNNSRNPQQSRSTPNSAGKQTSHSNREAAPREAAPREAGKRVGNIDPFELFCAYHLGITKDKGYCTANINEVANRFRAEPGMIKQALKEYDMDPESLMDRDFDLALGQLDIQVAPEGVDRLELARGIFQEFQNAPRHKRDWKKLLEEDRKENQKIFRN